ncbi:MAG: carbohydrate-binding family 9-like protein [Planctomycetota bacterium]
MPTYRCRKTPVPPPIDGRISPKAWDLAEAVPLMLADTGKTPVQPTEVRLLYDDAYLYVAFHCVDDEIWGTFTKRKEHVCSEEAVEVFIDPAASGRYYCEIEVSPRNTIYDLWNLNDPRCSPAVRHLEDWTCQKLRTAVHVEGELNSRTGNDKYWNCELSIPFAEMHGAANIPPKPGDRWRVNLYRIDRRSRSRGSDEYSAWAKVDKIDFHQPGKFGELLFLAPGEE